MKGYMLLFKWTGKTFYEGLKWKNTLVANRWNVFPIVKYNISSGPIYKKIVQFIDYSINWKLQF